ncbi:MAG: peptidoglycan-binding protein [Cytophagales bacterium]|nr:MAG: peptidoglycan-binding protein [Cytophagales bacterium]
MKRILLIAAAASIIYIAINQYITYRRYNPANNYTYQPNDNVDANYHNPQMVKEYYELTYEIGSFARNAWYSDGIDVLYIDNTDAQSQNAIKKYNQMLARVKFLENKLLTSKELKKQGFGNEEIIFIEKKGINPAHYHLFKIVEKNTFNKGDTGEIIWTTQEKLIKLGYLMPYDGKFIDITEDALKKFQQKNKLRPTGVIDEATLRSLLNSKQ